MSEETVPAAAQLVRDFVNTREPQTGAETLLRAADLRDWLARHAPEAAGAALGEDDLAVALAVREGLRAVLAGHAGADPDPAALQHLDEALRSVPVRLQLTPGGQRLLPADGSALARALAPVLDAVRGCAQDRDWPRLKACCRESCRWAYYDTSRNLSRRWCSMAGCGNHVKMQRAYATRRARQPQDQSAAAGGSSNSGRPSASRRGQPTSAVT